MQSFVSTRFDIVTTIINESNSAQSSELGVYRGQFGTSAINLIGQEDGDYRESWQPQMMSDNALKAAQYTAGKVVDALGGYGIFGVELFVKGDHVIFNEVSPRPHDTGLVTLLSQDSSEFALHVRAFTGMPIKNIT